MGRRVERDEQVGMERVVDLHRDVPTQVAPVPLPVREARVMHGQLDVVAQVPILPGEGDVGPGERVGRPRGAHQRPRYRPCEGQCGDIVVVIRCPRGIQGDRLPLERARDHAPVLVRVEDVERGDGPLRVVHDRGHRRVADFQPTLSVTVRLIVNVPGFWRVQLTMRPVAFVSQSPLKSQAYPESRITPTFPVYAKSVDALPSNLTTVPSSTRSVRPFAMLLPVLFVLMFAVGS